MSEPKTSVQGQVLKTRNANYSGKTAVPPAGAGLAGVAADHIESLAVNAVGADGNEWLVVN